MQSLILTLSLLSSALTSLQVTLTEIKIAEAEEAPVVTQVEIPAILKEIARCESGNRQFGKDGKVLRGRVNPKDVGLYQINEYWHLADSKKMGIDIYTSEGNEEYALYLYRTQGTRPWNASKPCWSPAKAG